MNSTRPPRWHRDEIILALALYRTLDPKDMNVNNILVLELSELLNRIPLHERRAEHEKFRNVNSVVLKLGNFKAIDPEFIGQGMSSFSKNDEKIFFEFYGNVTELQLRANQIKNTVMNEAVNKELYKIQDDYEDGDYLATEGKVIYKLHKLRERNNKLNNKKKELYLKKYGKLDCEVCKFDFFETYGELGKGFIEAHHRVPLSEIYAEQITKLDDLALVCSNCHRMLHRSISIDELKKIIGS